MNNSMAITEAEWAAIEDAVTTDEAGNVIVSGSHLARAAPGAYSDVLHRIVKGNVVDGFGDYEWSIEWATVRRKYAAEIERLQRATAK